MVHCQLCSFLFECLDSSFTNFVLLTAASVADRFNRDRAMYYHIYMIMHVKDPKLSVIREGIVSLSQAAVCLYILHMLNSGIDMIQTNKLSEHHHLRVYLQNM